MYINLLADSFASSTCTTLKPFLNIVGYVVIIVKIVIPILLVVFGMLDVGKSVISFLVWVWPLSAKSLAYLPSNVFALIFLRSISLLFIFLVQ